MLFSTCLLRGCVSRDVCCCDLPFDLKSTGQEGDCNTCLGHMYSSVTCCSVVTCLLFPCALEDCKRALSLFPCFSVKRYSLMVNQSPKTLQCLETTWCHTTPPPPPFKPLTLKTYPKAKTISIHAYQVLAEVKINERLQQRTLPFVALISTTQQHVVQLSDVSSGQEQTFIAFRNKGVLISKT